MMLMLGVARRALDHDRHVKAGGWWDAPNPRMVDLAGRTVLVVGYGRIGSRVANYCRAFQMKVLVMDPGFHPMRIAADGFTPARDLHAALAEADVVTLHCPLSPATRHLMDDAAFAALKPGAILVNTARGPIVSQAALVAALQIRPAARRRARRAGGRALRRRPTRSTPSRMSSSARTTPPAPRKAWRGWRGRRRATSSTCWTASATRPSWSTTNSAICRTYR